jgi:hypothetical protein
MEPGKKVVFTWGNESGPGIEIKPGSTRVEITLEAVPAELGGGVRVRLRHYGLASETMRREHLLGWKHYLTMLARQAAEAQAQAAIAGVLENYCDAWREMDSARRRSMLEHSCERDIRVRSGFACTDSIEELEDHIRNSLHHMPGSTLVLDGVPQVSHNFARHGWAVRGPDGRLVIRGENLVKLSAGGKIAEVTSFPGGSEATGEGTP